MKTAKKIVGIALALACGLAATLKAQIYVANPGITNGTGSIGEYRLDGTPINPLLITNMDGPYGIAISGTNLFVANSYDGTIGEYTTSGVTVNASLIANLDAPVGIAICGTNLFVVSFFGTVGEYTTSGATINTFSIFRPGSIEFFCIAVSGTNLFVGYDNDEVFGLNQEGCVGEYTTSGATVNASLISDLDGAYSIAVSGTNLFVGSSGTIGEYTTSGAAINASLITGFDVAAPDGIAILGNDLFVADYTSFPIYTGVGEFNTSGAVINASLISEIGAWAIAVVPLPQLNIADAGNQSVLYYQAWATNYILQSTTNLTSPNWQAVSNSAPVLTVTNNQPIIVVTVTNNLPAEFFQLAPAP